MTTPTHPKRRRRVRGDGVDLAVHEQGDPARPTVLLVHGYPDTHAVWDEVADRLADRHHVVRYDVRGAGASSRPYGRRRYAFAYLMADMAAVLDATTRDREKVHLVGHDWGSIQSWEAACTMPERFASFTSISGPCLDHAAQWTRRRLTRPTPRDLRRVAGQGLRSWYIYFFQTPLLPEALWRAGLAAPFARALELGEGVPARPGHPARTLPRDGAAGVGLYRANMPERLRRPRDRRTAVPTQVIVPTRDLFVSPHLVGDLADRVPDLSLRTIDAGHWVPRSHPETVADWIREHIAGATGGPLTAAQERALRGARVTSARRPLEGALAVVTGAGSGTGRAAALAFAGRGAEVVAADADLAAAHRTAELAGRHGPAAHAFQVDAADPRAVEDFAKQLVHAHGVPDVVVDGAGTGLTGRLPGHAPGDWRRILDVGLRTGRADGAAGGPPAARVHARRGFAPGAVVAAVRDDGALVPVTPEAPAGHLLSRLARRARPMIQ